MKGRRWQAVKSSLMLRLSLRLALRAGPLQLQEGKLTLQRFAFRPALQHLTLDQLALQLRGARGDWWQVWDAHRERGGFVRASQVMALPPGERAVADLQQRSALGGAERPHPLHQLRSHPRATPPDQTRQSRSGHSLSTSQLPEALE